MQSNTDWLAANPGKTIVDLLEWRAGRRPRVEPRGYAHGEVDEEGYVWYLTSAE